MIRKLLVWFSLALALAALVLALLLVRPGDVFEMLIGFVVGTLGAAQWMLLIATTILLTIGVIAGRPLQRWHRRIALVGVGVIIALGAFITRRDRKYFSREMVMVSGNDVTLHGTLYRPRNEQAKRPAILILHGSGPVRHDAYHLFARRFAEHGFLVLNVDKRGVGGSTGRYYGDDLGKGVIEQRTSDALSALKFLTTLPDVDTARVGVFSMSQGGWVVSQLLDGASPARYGVVFSGVAVSSAEEGRWSDWAGEDKDHFGFNPPPIPFEEIDRRMRSVAPGDFDPRAALKRMTAPSVWMFGEWDSSAPTAASLRVLDSLRAEHIPVESHVFAEANHGLAVVRGPRGKRNADFAEGLWDSVFAWTDQHHITNARQE